MARQRTIYLTGKIANLIFYQWKGIPCSRIMPTEVHQTTATKASAGVFGQAVRISKYLRESLMGFVPDYKDKPFTFKMNEEVRQWLTLRKDPAGMEQAGLPLNYFLEYNKESFLHMRCRVKLGVDWQQPGEVRITLPELNPTQNLSVPAHTETILFRFALGGCVVSKDQSINKGVAEIRIPCEHAVQPAQTVSIPFTPLSDTLAIVMMDMKYERVDKQATMGMGVIQRVWRKDSRWTPCGVVASHYYP